MNARAQLIDVQDSPTSSTFGYYTGGVEDGDGRNPHGTACLNVL